MYLSPKWSLLLLPTALVFLAAAYWSRARLSQSSPPPEIRAPATGVVNTHPSQSTSPKAAWPVSTSSAASPISPRSASSLGKDAPTAIERNGALAAIDRNENEVQRLYLRVEQERVPERYAALFRKLNLTSSEIDRVRSLLDERRSARLDLSLALKAQNLSRSSSAADRLIQELETEFARRISLLLGSPGLEILIEHERKLPVWDLVNNFAGAVAMEGDPLTPSQAEELVSTLALASPSYQAGDMADPNEIDWEVVGEQSAPLLTPAQRTSFLNFAPIYPVPSPGD